MTRKQAAINWATLATAAAAGIGTGIKAYVDAGSQENVETVIATEVVRQNERWAAAEDDLSGLADGVSNLSEQVTALRVGIAKVEVAIEYLTKDRRWKAGQVIEGGSVIPPMPPQPAPPRSRDLKIKTRKPHIEQTALEQKKAELF